MTGERPDPAGKHTVMFVVVDERGERNFGIIWIKEKSAQDAMIGAVRMVSKKPEIWKDVDENATLVRVQEPDSEAKTEWTWQEARGLALPVS